MRVLALCLAAAVPGLVLWFAGAALAGHLLFALGYTAASADLLHDAALKGTILAREGRWEAAASVFAQARGNAYNRGIALARSAHYHDAIDAFDDVLEGNPEDADAQFNKDVVRKILADGAVDAGPAKGMANATANKEHKGKASDIGDGEAGSTGNGYVGSQEGSSQSGAQGGSKVSRTGAGQASSDESGLGKATGSATQGAGIGRAGGDMADVTAMLAENQRRIVRGHTEAGVVATPEWLQTLPDDPGRYLKLRILAEQKRRAARATPEEDGD